MLPTQSHITPAAPADADFLHRRVEAFRRERLYAPGVGRDVLVSGPAGEGAIFLRSNDYLAISGHPRIIGAEIAALQAYGHGHAVSRIFVQHEEDGFRAFERRVARLMGAEDAVLCMSGYNANVGLLQTIAGPEVPVYIDLRAHASLWEGIGSARAQARPFRHNSPEHLERLMRAHGPGVVVVDALYSTHGALCPLAAIVEVAERHGGVLVVDETHSFGTLGPNGSGLTVASGLAHRVHFRTAGLSKAVASRGGMVVGSARNMEYFRYAALPLIFSTSVLAHEVAGYQAALDVIEGEGWRRDRLHANHAYLRQGLDELGYNVDACEAQIIALEAGAEEMATRLRLALERHGVFGSGFCPPASPKNRAFIRLTVNASLNSSELDQVLAAAAEIRNEIGLHRWPSTTRRVGLQSRRAA